MRALLVIPAFRESARLPRYLRELLETLAQTDHRCEVQVVDDGSGPEEARQMREMVEELRPQYPLLLAPLCLPRNRGKGGAIRAGLENSESYDWVGFVDADGAISACEVCRLLDLALDPDTPGAALFGSRVKMLGRKVDRSGLRHLTGRFFAFLVAMHINSEVYDSQCGIKLIPAAAWRRIAPWLREDGFCFDVELLAGLQKAQIPVEEVPICWTDCPGSKVSLLRDSWRMFQGIRRIQTRSAAWTS